jgi:lactoylglutathione lyase
MYLKHIDHAGLNVTDLARSSNFYLRVFDFEIVHKFTRTWLVGRGNMRLGLFHRPEAKPIDDLDNKIAITHIAFETNKRGFKKAQEELKALGIPFDPPEDTGIAFSIFFNDPDGHLLEITTYHN